MPIFPVADVICRYRFHQSTELLYLCGFMEPDSVLLLDADGESSLPDHKAVLYVRPRDPFRELWDGPRAGTEDAVDFTGVDEVCQMNSFLIFLALHLLAIVLHY